MDKRLSKALEKVQSDTQRASSKSISSGINPAPLLGKADCPHCGGVGFLRVDVPLGHETERAHLLVLGRDGAVERSLALDLPYSDVAVDPLGRILAEHLQSWLAAGPARTFCSLSTRSDSSSPGMCRRCSISRR